MTLEDRLRRVIDLAMATALLLISIPLWLPIAVAIRLSSPGPVLYQAPRIGKDGIPFTMYKFRTMRAGAAGVGPAITVGRDPRITPIGRQLRRWKLDELPQLLNVLRVEMGLVGPRPEAPEYVALYDERQRQALSVRPGITGPSQVIHRHEERLLDREDAEAHYRTVLLPRKLEIDLDYIENRSVAGDLRVIAKTVTCLFHR
jgi:lipopolysaccharide/colanic/teichoic acid biosynthesis glycosyltransferase